MTGRFADSRAVRVPGRWTVGCAGVS